MDMRSVSKPSGFLLSVLFFLSLVAGCASTGGMKNVSQDSLRNKVPRQSLVLGRLSFHDNSSFFVQGVGSTVRRSTMTFSRASGAIPENKDLFHDMFPYDTGYFALIMEPGEYHIESINVNVMQAGGNLKFTAPTTVKFKVPEGKSIYIGSISLTFRYAHGIPFIKNKEFEYKIDILDNYLDDIKVLKEKYPFLPKEILNSPSISG